MKWIQRTFRLSFFIVYLLALLAVPLVVIWGWIGFLISIPAVLMILVWIRTMGMSAIRQRLLASEPLVELPDFLRPGLAEIARRAGIAVPEILLIKSESLNIGCFGFNSNAVVLTPAILSLPRGELMSLIAREVVDIAEYRVEFGTWLSQFLRLLDWLTGSITGTGRVSFRAFLREAVLWPLTIVPLWCLEWRVDTAALDKKSVSLMRTGPVFLATAYRQLELENVRAPLRIAVSERHLFRLPPRSEESAARAVFSVETLSKRIRLLEKIWQGS